MYDRKITTEEAERASIAEPAPPRRRWPFVLGAALMLAGGGYFWQQRANTPPVTPPVAAAPAPALTVTVAPATSRSIAAMVAGDGSVVAWQELLISTEIGGLRIIRAPIEEGDTVRAGQLLAALDDSVLAAQLAQADAAINESVAFIEFARTEQARAEELVRSNTGSRQVVEQRQSATRQAEARLLSARARRDEVAARLAQTQILAPTDGIVSRVAVRIGAVTAVGQEMFRIIRDGRLELEARVPELELAALRAGQPVVVSHGGREIAAELRIVAPVVAAETRLGIARVALPAGSGLRPGMFARAEITGAPREVIMVPASAVVFREGAPQAFVLPEGESRVAMRRLVAGARQEGMVEIRDGLRAGDRVVTAGAGFLADGDMVRISP